MGVVRAVLALVLVVMMLPLGSLSSSPASGMLRSFHEAAPVEFEGAYDIKVDENGIYVVGARHVRDTSGKFPVDALNPYILILEPDHRLRCTNYLEFPMDTMSRGMAIDLEHNTTHLIVSGYYLFSDSEAALFVASFDKNNCKLAGIYQHFLTKDKSGLGVANIYSRLFGKGVDVAVDETGFYVLTGLTIFEFDGKQGGFLVIKLDSSLNYVNHQYYTVAGFVRGNDWFAEFDFATSIAVGSDAVYVAGGVVQSPTLVELLRGHMSDLFLLRIDKTSLDLLDHLMLTKREATNWFFVGTEVLVDENDDIYIVTTDLYAPQHDVVEVYKYRYTGGFQLVWSAGYYVENVYTRDDVPGSQSGISPPELVGYDFSYSLSAAVGGPYLYVGGFISKDWFPLSELSFNNGFLSAIDKNTGTAMFTFRIQPHDNPYGQTFVHGVTMYQDCAYIAGGSDSYRLEYVFQNILHKTIAELRRDKLPKELRVDVSPREDSYKVYDWPPTFDVQNKNNLYSFYGYFCPGRLVNTQTTTSTVTETTTATQTTTATVTDTRTTTATTTSTFATTTTSTETSTVTSTSVITGTSTTTTTATMSTTSTATATVTSTRFTTSTATSTETIPFTATVTSTFTAVRTQTSTATLTERVARTEYFTNVVYTTRFVTESRLATATLSEIVTATRFFDVTHATTVTNLVFLTQQAAGGAAPSTATVQLNTTQTGVRTETRAGQTDWASAPPWFYIPFFLLPLPLAAVLLSGRKHRIVINKADVPPMGWKPGDAPTVDDIYMMPSVLSVKKNTVVEFVNKDETTHIVACYEGPAEHLFESEEIKPGKKWKQKFREPGVYY
ncbi:MAG: hypothetical protein NZ581_07545, partial [Candidatus Caldarchaeum sp.]|nr:hypothetical protein [Candidatus Caldarchaeum sp.]MDW8436029.1 hypothetical protein [Candidatus Caldarchaeum sp.]